MLTDKISISASFLHHHLSRSLFFFIYRHEDALYMVSLSKSLIATTVFINRFLLRGLFERMLRCMLFCLKCNLCNIMFRQVNCLTMKLNVNQA